jgi:hypothetical protein
MDFSGIRMNSERSIDRGRIEVDRALSKIDKMSLQVILFNLLLGRKRTEAQLRKE